MVPVGCPPSDMRDESVDKKIISVNIPNTTNIPLKMSPLFTFYIFQ